MLEFIAKPLLIENLFITKQLHCAFSFLKMNGNLTTATYISLLLKKYFLD